MTGAISPSLSSLARYFDSMFMMTIATKRNKMAETSASVCLLLATALLVWDVYAADSLKRCAWEMRGSAQC